MSIAALLTPVTCELFRRMMAPNEQNSMELHTSTETSKTNPRISKGLSHNGAPGGYIDDRPLVTACSHGFKRGEGFACTYCDLGMDHGIQRFTA